MVIAKILDEVVVCISLCANGIRKGMNQTLWP